jgi:hypothetical protein
LYNQNLLKKENKNEIKNLVPIYVYLTDKANGENFQLSYNKDFESWIIGSKNVTIILKEKNDLKFYEEYNNNNTLNNNNNNNYANDNNNNENNKKIQFNKYQYCIEFAYLWFNILEEKIKIKSLIEELKNDLHGYTLVGENVGDKNHQHIKLYKERDIHFYSLIKNNSDNICENFQKCKKFLGKYNLTMVNYQRYEIIGNKNELKNFLKELYINTLNKTVEEGGEGNVIYFSKIKNKNEKEDEKENENEEIFQLAKMKTFEYKFLRMIREKIRNLNNQRFNETTIGKIKEKLDKDSKDLLLDNISSINFNYYISLADFILGFVFYLGRNLNYMENYAIMINYLKNKFIYLRNISEFKNKNFNLIKLYNENYNNEEICKLLFIDLNDKNEFEFILEKIYKENNSQLEVSIKEKENNNNNNENNNNNNVINYGINYFLEYFKELNDPNNDLLAYDKINYICSKSKFKIGKIYIFANISLIASGKSTLFLTLKEEIFNTFPIEDINFDLVSSDSIRSELVKQNPNLNMTQINYDSFINSKSAAEFNKKTIELLKENYNENKFNFFYADKNFFPDSIRKFSR